MNEPSSGGPPGAAGAPNRLRALAVPVALLVLSAASPAPRAGAQPLTPSIPGDALVEPGTLTFAASGEFRPFSYVDDEQRLAGFDIEVGEAIAGVLGLEPSPRKYKFAAIVEGVKTGRFDAAIASHTITPERLAHVDFSTPYYYSGPQIFVRPESDVRDSTDLGGAEIAVSKGSTYARMAATFTDRIKVYDSDVTALEALDSGRHDAVITDFITGRMAIQEGMDVVGRQLLGRSEQAIAVAKDNAVVLDAVNDALDALRANGELARISRTFFGDDITVDPTGGTGTRAEAVATADEHPIVHFFRVLVESRDVFIRAMILTVQLTIVAILVGCVIGLLFAFAKLSKMPPLEWVANAYIYLVRGTPLIVQIFVLYFGLTDIVKISGFWAAAIALAFHNGAYIAEIFRGAIESIDRGQMEAGRSLGMSTRLTYRRVVLPQAGLRALPALGNQFIIGLKDSSLAAFISINELFNVATTQGANNFDQMTYLLVVAVYYLVLVLALTMLVQTMETRMGRGRLA